MPHTQTRERSHEAPRTLWALLQRQALWQGWGCTLHISGDCAQPRSSSEPLRPLHIASFPAQERQQCSGTLAHSSMSISPKSGADRGRVPIAPCLVVAQSSSSIPADGTPARPWGAGTQVCAQPVPWWSSMELWLHPRRLKPSDKAAFLSLGWALGMLAHSSVPRHTAPEGLGMHALSCILFHHGCSNRMQSPHIQKLSHPCQTGWLRDLA